ncbi:MAG: helix-turn-helix transcriptional regulator [Paludibacteraceae bacterium]|nr:helix-turn-helix transcriptional regulator [Paludibacteraceae bacterium]
MPNIYTLEQESVDDLTKLLAGNLQRRRLEKVLSRSALSVMSGVPTPTITKFEQQHIIALTSFVALAQALGYTADIKQLLSEPHFSTMEELETINRNKNRKRGRNEFGR